MKLTEFNDRLRLDLADDTTLLTDDRCSRALEMAVSDLSRYFPRERIYDYTVLYDYDDEEFTSDEDAWVTLSHPMIDAESEVVKDSTKATTYTRDTDYVMDYANGKIYTKSTGSIGDAKTCYVSYETIRVAIDLSSTGCDIASSLVRIGKIEYPVGNVPQDAISSELYGDNLFLTSSQRESQSNLTEKKHVWIHYLSYHTPPTLAAAGTYPDFLDDVVAVGAQAYMYGILNNYWLGQAKANLTLAVSELAGIITEAQAAGDRVAGIDALATLAEGALDKVTTQAAAAGAYWDAGDDKIDAINLGSDVGRLYLEYGTGEMRIAEAHIAEANARMNIGVVLISEAAAMTNANTSVMSAVDDYFTAAIRDVELADRNRSFADKRFTDFYGLLADRQQWLRNKSTTPVRQGKY